MIQIEQIRDITKFRLARTVFGRGLYFTAAYMLDGLIVDTGCAYTVRELTEALAGSELHTIVNREDDIQKFLGKSFSKILGDREARFRLGFDVAASGQGDLAAIYIDEAKGNDLLLRGLFTCRTEDWHFLKTVLHHFLKRLHSVQGAGDESGLGRQICWEAARQFSNKFIKVNLASKKHDLGFALMNQLSVAAKRFPRSEQDIAADYFALRKTFSGSKWVFSEGRNSLNPASHCDIAWAGALASHAHAERRGWIGAATIDENGVISSSDRHLSREERMLWSDDPAIWHPLRF